MRLMNDNIEFLKLRLQSNPNSYLFARLADELLKMGDINEVKMSKKELILKAAGELVADFLYYDRKMDLNLPYGSIEKAVLSGEVTINEIVEAFKKTLVKDIK